ncbi:MAG TPA: AAA family ATPase, partial [Armatimonadota bacterium]
MTIDATPRWMREIARLSAFKSQLYLYGNIKDTVLFPMGEEEVHWTLGSVREALFELFRTQIGGYDLVATYNLLDGMVFADAQDANRMEILFDALVGVGEKADQSRTKGRVPQPLKSPDPLDQALQQIRLCLMNRTNPCVFIIEHASQLLASPVNLPPAERMGFLRLLKASGESQIVSVAGDEGGPRRPVQNMLLLLCDKLTDLPAWLYLNNPFAGSIEVEQPKVHERRHFFDLFLAPPPPTEEEPTPSGFDADDLADLTEGMSVRDLCGIRALARRSSPEDRPHEKTLVDTFKYGGKESEWDALDWGRLTNAEDVLAERVIGQPAAVAAVADVLRRARLHLSGAQHSGRTKPRGVLFFAGPTGVGKTELGKAIAELIFGTDDACVRFDMSEYSQAHADQRLLGAPPGYIGYEEGGQLTNRMKSDPFCVLLFDEIEKAHPSVLDKFLQILEDGRMTDGRGETVYFSESIIIFTSNIGIYQLDPETGRPRVDPFTGLPLLHVDPTVDVQYQTV